MLTEETLYQLHKVKEIRVDSLPHPTRLTNYCEGLFENLPTKSSLKKAFKRGEIYVNNESATSGYWICEGDRIQLMDLELQKPKPYALDIRILYEDECLAAVDKPAGIPVSGNQYRTLQNAVVDKLTTSKLRDVLGWPRPVHRLDAPTSGIVVFAKTASARIKLGAMFEQKQITKTYHAIVVGSPPAAMTIETPISGKKAISHVQVEQTFHALRTETMSLVKLSPVTGRTHQLRIHMESIGHPIVGDPLYGQDVGIRHKGLFLTASHISFSHPTTGNAVEVTCAIPHKFYSLMHREARRWDLHQRNRHSSADADKYRN